MTNRNLRLIEGGFTTTLVLLVLFLAIALLDPQAKAEIKTGDGVSGRFEYPFQDPNLPVEKRIDNIVSLMTLDEKVACLGVNPSVPRLGIKGSSHVEGIHGLAQGGPAKWGRPQVVPTTTFPQGIGLGETWDTDLLRKVAQVEGTESRFIFQSPKYHQGGIVIRSPNADLGRDPRWGRTEECYGEDPFFNGKMVVAFVKGLQGDDPKYWRSAALLKHFLANSNEDGRGSSSSNFDERLFREYYSVPFRMGIEEGGARAFMASYNSVNGVPMAINPILENVTRDEWGEDGIICTDGGGMTQLVTEHKAFAANDGAAAAVIKAGIGQFLDRYRDATLEALKKGTVTESDINRVLRGNFRVMIKLGLLDPPAMVPYSSLGSGADPWTGDEDKKVARLATQESVVLLKNAGGILPLDRKSLKSVAVIGPYADQVNLDWYSGTPPYAISPVQGIRAALAGVADVKFSTGNDINEATNLARGADYAIVVVGNHPTCNAGWAKCPLPSDGKEAIDRKSITLEQEEIVKAAFAANPKTIVVLVSSFPFAINWTQEHVPAILHMAHNSQEEGNALADVLFGDFNPAGRLVQTWPGSIEQLPPMMDYDIRHGRTYMYFKGAPLYPFGFGLSYTKFEYSNMRVSSSTITPDGHITVTVDIRNTGKRSGEEVAQLYVRHIGSSVERPLSELKGFRRVAIGAGEKKTVSIDLNATDLAYWNVDRHKFIVEPDKVELLVGASSADIRARKTVAVHDK